MPLHGPIVVVSDTSNIPLATAIKSLHDVAIVECNFAQAADAIKSSWPASVVVSDRPKETHKAQVEAISAALDIMRIRDCYLPALMRVGTELGPAIANALPIGMTTTPERIIAQVMSAQRVRRLEQTVKRRAASLKAEGRELFEPEQGDPIADASVLVCGRGKNYPELCTAIGEQFAIIGALSVEIAAKHLTSRPLDGIFIGPGFTPPMVNAFLTVLSEDPRFRDIPVALIGGPPVTANVSVMPNFERFNAPPSAVLAWMLPLVRLRAYGARLQRQLAAIEANGILDPRTGLFTSNAFAEEFKRAITEARRTRQPMSLARFWFARDTDQRAVFDIARQASRIRRSLDFVSLAPDGSILLALPNTKIKQAHVAAKRFANAFKETVITAGTPEGKAETNIALATLQPDDTADTLLARVFETIWIPEAAE